jgi:glycosyltransferase involved in cell wall biosynthesis
MTIAVLSDAPVLTTGFGVTTRQIADALHDAGWDVACFGLKATPDDIVGQSRHFTWPAERGGPWTQSLQQFFATVQPRLLLLNMDAYNAVECLEAVQSAGYRGPVASYVVFDGLPVGRHFLDAQRSCAAVLASSYTAAAFLHANGLKVVGVAPAGVDGDVFVPSPEVSELRIRAGLGDAAVIGVFGTNTERKQIPRVLSALPSIKDRLSPSRVVLYLHCRPTGYWRLAEMADEMGLREHVLFPTTSRFDERRGVHKERSHPIGAYQAAATGVLPASLSYVDRLNCCDVVVNVPHSGDIEQVILETQACGVPLVHTDDEGIMAEAVGAGGVLLPARDIGTGRCGERIHHVAATDIANAVESILKDEGLRSRLCEAGLENASRYTWTALRTAACELVERCLS